MNTFESHSQRLVLVAGTWALIAVTTACSGTNPANAPATAATAAVAGPRAIDVVRVTEQPLNVQLSLPGELTARQSVAIFARVTGFVKSVQVDRGSQVHAGEVLAVLDAPELVAQRAEAQSKLQAAEAQLAAVRAKADADASTFERLKAASATPGVVAGNDVLIAEKMADASRNQVLASQQSAEAARQAANAVTDMESYLRVRAPFDGVVIERNVHPGALVGTSNGGTGATPMLRVVQARQLRLVVPVPEAYTSNLAAGAQIGFAVAAFRASCSRARSRASPAPWTSRHGRWPWNSTSTTPTGASRRARSVRCSGR